MDCVLLPLSRNGPFSMNNPSMLEQPGPPFILRPAPPPRAGEITSSPTARDEKRARSPNDQRRFPVLRLAVRAVVGLKQPVEQRARAVGPAVFDG